MFPVTGWSLCHRGCHSCLPAVGVGQGFVGDNHLCDNLVGDGDWNAGLRAHDGPHHLDPHHSPMQYGAPALRLQLHLVCAQYQTTSCSTHREGHQLLASAPDCRGRLLLS